MTTQLPDRDCRITYALETLIDLFSDHVSETLAGITPDEVKAWLDRRANTYVAVRELGLLDDAAAAAELRLDRR